jgi:hypothetical protein
VGRKGGGSGGGAGEAGCCVVERARAMKVDARRDEATGLQLLGGGPWVAHDITLRGCIDFRGHIIAPTRATPTSPGQHPSPNHPHTAALLKHYHGVALDQPPP